MKEDAIIFNLQWEKNQNILMFFFEIILASLGAEVRGCES